MIETKTDEIEVNGIIHQVRIHCEYRRNTRVYIGRNCVSIRIPSFLGKEEQLQQLNRMKDWVRKKLLANHDKFKPMPHKEYKDGDLLSFNGKKYRLEIHINKRKTGSVCINSNSINLGIPSGLSRKATNKTVSMLISRCIGAKYLSKLKEKIYELNKRHFNRTVNKIRFKYNSSNWGSCSKKGNINISTRLLLAPEDILDYVCVHELAHLVEYSHSKRFWTLVERAMPDYKEKKEWLKMNGHKCIF